MHVLRLLICCCFCIGSWAAFAADILSPEAFAERFAQGLRKALPSAIVTVKGAELVLKDPASGTNTSLVLENAYTDYRHDSARLDHLLTAYITAMRQARSAQATPRQDGGEPTGQKIDRARIVPVIKDRQWIDHNLNGLKARGVTAEFVFDDLNKNLVVVYAEDDAARTRYLMSGEDPGVARQELRALAVANLRRMLPKTEVSHENDVIIVSAGGDYDASLLLLDEIWSGGQIKVDGDIVVAIPARNVLLVTGSKNRAGLRTVRTLVAKVTAEGAHALTRTLFVYRNGGFRKFGKG